MYTMWYIGAHLALRQDEVDDRLLGLSAIFCSCQFYIVNTFIVSTLQQLGQAERFQFGPD